MTRIQEIIIQEIINSIPPDVLLGVMATDINPSSVTTCLVCRMVSPDKPFNAREAGCDFPYEAAAEALGLEVSDMSFLFGAANLCTEEVEEAIANRLNELVAA